MSLLIALWANLVVVAASFGAWQESISAGLFMIGLLHLIAFVLSQWSKFRLGDSLNHETE